MWYYGGYTNGTYCGNAIPRDNVDVDLGSRRSFLDMTSFQMPAVKECMGSTAIPPLKQKLWLWHEGRGTDAATIRSALYREK